MSKVMIKCVSCRDVLPEKEGSFKGKNWYCYMCLEIMEEERLELREGSTAIICDEVDEYIEPSEEIVSAIEMAREIAQEEGMQ